MSYEIKSIRPREYQKHIAESSLKENTLVVLPTGLGKTIIAIIVAIKRIRKFPMSKVLMLAPTRPLCNQHRNSFKKFTNLNENEIVLITGKIPPRKREELYKEGKVIVATPHCVKNDLERNYVDFSKFSLLVVDEAHRAVKDYPYVFIAKEYMKKSMYPLILGLTASPGGKIEKIKEIKKNLFIKNVEIRSEKDEDVISYVKEVKKKWIYVELPDEIKKIKSVLEQCINDDIEWLKSKGFLQTSKPSKKGLLELQRKIIKMLNECERKNYLFQVIRKVSETIKLYHSLELLETQGIESLYDFLNKLSKSKNRTDKLLMRDPRILYVFEQTKHLKERGFEHPKMKKLLKIVKDILNKNPKEKMIIFANYRRTVEKIRETLEKNGIKVEILVGQAKKGGKGLTQKQQVRILKKFADGEFNVLIATSIGEEGLDIIDVNTAIFYEAVPSEIRMLQRRGRVGRVSKGRIIILLTKKTMDEAYYWAAFHRERKMKSVLYQMMKKKKSTKTKTLIDWLKR